MEMWNEIIFLENIRIIFQFKFTWSSWWRFHFSDSKMHFSMLCDKKIVLFAAIFKKTCGGVKLRPSKSPYKLGNFPLPENHVAKYIVNGWLIKGF